MSIKTRPEFLASLPAATQARLGELQQSIETVLGSDLAALLVYGGAVRGRAAAGPGPDEIQLMLVVREASLEKLARLASAVTMARYAIGIETMVLTSAEVPAAADVFPLLYDDIAAAHVVLAGADPFSRLAVSDRHRRLRIEQELREAQIRLRRLVLDSLGAREVLLAGLVRKLRLLRSPLRALLKLRQFACREPLADVLTAAGQLYGVDVTPLLPPEHDPARAAAALAQLLAAATHDVDQLPE